MHPALTVVVISLSCRVLIFMPYADKEKQKAYFKAYKEKRKEFYKEYNKKYKEENREKINQLANNWAKNNKPVVQGYILRRRYGIGVDEYNRLFELQNGRCAICQIHQSEFTRAFHVDHCHKSNKIRGLLCVNCNTALGHFKEKIEIIELAIVEKYFNVQAQKGAAKFGYQMKVMKSAIEYLLK